MSRLPERLGVVLDANVLYRQWLRDVMLTLAVMGYYDPTTSPSPHSVARSRPRAFRSVTFNTAHFRSARFVGSDRVAVLDPASFLVAVLEEDQEVMAAVLEPLASNRRCLSSVADVLDELDRNEALRPFVEVARNRLL